MASLIKQLKTTYKVLKKRGEYEAIKEFSTKEDMKDYCFANKEMISACEKYAFSKGSSATIVLTFSILTETEIFVRRLFVYHTENGRTDKIYDRTPSVVDEQQLLKDGGTPLSFPLYNWEEKYLEAKNFGVPNGLNLYRLEQDVLSYPFAATNFGTSQEEVITYQHPESRKNISIYITKEGQFRFAQSEMFFDTFAQAFQHLEGYLRQKRLEAIS